MDIIPSISVSSMAFVYMEKDVKVNNSGRISIMPKPSAAWL
jgi:hypothetical protein